MKTTVCEEINRFGKLTNAFVVTVLLVGLFYTSLISYLLFHSLAEIFSIVVAFSLFTITWNSREHIKNQYLLFIGVAYLFIGIIDLLHTLSYKGMSIFLDYDFYANQLWIGARYLESISLLCAFYFLGTKKQIRPSCLVVIFSIVTAILILSIFTWRVFPECFIANQGLTPFKKFSEYIICSILTLNIFLLAKNRAKFEQSVFKLLLWALIFSIIAELAFTFYISNYGFSNLIGHYFKIFSFFMIYLSIVQTGIKNPMNLIFLELDRTNKQLHDEIETRKQTEIDLHKALSEVKTLSGMLPICASCKNIRDDKGYWRQIEAFVKEHSDANFSHGICPDCVKKLYPDIANSVFKIHQPNVRYTGLASRSYFDKIFPKEWARCVRDNKKLSLIILVFKDINSFEKNAVLDLENMLRDKLHRPTDYLTGYNDESYAVILSDTNDQGAQQVAETIVDEYTNFQRDYSKSDVSTLSLRVAITSCSPVIQTDFESFLEETEKFVFPAKEVDNEQIIQKIIQ